MTSENESSGELTSPSGKWVSDKKTINRYTRNGMIWGALGGFALYLCRFSRCWIVKNSVGCGPSGEGKAVGLLALFILLYASLGFIAGNQIGKEHPAFRRLSICFLPFMYFFAFSGWRAVKVWLPPLALENYLMDDTSFGCFLTIAIASIYGLGRLIINRKLKSQALSQHQER